MRKTLSIMILVLVLMTSSMAFANPVDVTGNASIQYRDDSVGNIGDKGTVNKITVDVKANLNDKFSVYTRIFSEGYTTNNGYVADFRSNQYDGKYATGIDQFGVIFKEKGVNYKLGRQGIALGSTGLLYDSSSKLGKYNFIDGLKVDGKVLGTDVTAVVAEEQMQSYTTVEHSKLYALSGTKTINDLTLGAVAVRYVDPTGLKTRNDYAVNSAYKIGKSTIYGEVAQSTAVDQNLAFDYGVKWAFTPKLYGFVENYKVEANGDIANNTTFNNNKQGLHYGVGQSLSQTTFLMVDVYNNKALDTKVKDTSFRTTLNINF